MNFLKKSVRDCFEVLKILDFSDLKIRDGNMVEVRKNKLVKPGRPLWQVLEIVQVYKE